MSETDQGTVQPVGLLSNPGSSGHPSNCKPCNKYNPNRPDDSCKHGVTCAFCHGADHERPKHRGQRGRHALQRRQYLEARDQMPEQLRELVDNVYQEPPQIMEAVKKILLPLDDHVRQTQVQLIVESIALIGDAAQDKRPDNTRIRGLRMEVAEYTAASDLDSRFKWLTGTLHLMIRKMLDDDAKEDEEKFKAIRLAVTEILSQCRALPNQLEQRLSPLDSLEDEVDKLISRDEVSRAWLRTQLLSLASSELLAKEPDNNKVKQALLQLKDPLQRLPSLADDSEADRKKLEGCATLQDLRRALEEVIESIKDRLFDEDREIDFTDPLLLKSGHLLADLSKQEPDPERLRF